MTIQSRLKIFGQLFLAFLLLVTAYYFSSSSTKPIINITKQDSALNFNDNLINIVSVGQSRLLADLLWITTLLESDLDHYKGKDLNSWIFLRFRNIITLDPNFNRAYRFGGQYLSIIKDDLYGAKYIFEKGLAIFPNDHELIKYAAFLYAFELRDNERALELYSKLKGSDTAPRFLSSLIAKLKFGIHNDLEVILPVLQELYELEKDNGPLRYKLKKDIYAVKAQIDIECLNLKKSNCSKLDANGDPYLVKDGSYKSSSPFKPYIGLKLRNNQ